MTQLLNELLLGLYNNRPGFNDVNKFVGVSPFTEGMTRSQWQSIIDEAYNSGYIVYANEYYNRSLAMITEKGIEYLKFINLI